MLAVIVFAVTLVLGVSVLTLYVAPLVTIATDLVVSRLAANWVKAVVFAGLSFVSAAVTAAIQAKQGLALDNTLLAHFVMTVVVALAVYFGFTKPTGFSARLQAVKFPVLGSGIGAPKPPAA